MKYLKKYENYKGYYEGYKVGDYILVHIFYTDSSKDKNIKAKILEKKFQTAFPYSVVYDDGKVDTIMIGNISRFLTPDEIEEYETKIQAIKYNL